MASVGQGQTFDGHAVSERGEVSAFMLVEFPMTEGHMDPDADPRVVATIDIASHAQTGVR